jgi:hypothetical protein
MKSSTLSGRSILIAEDEPLIALDLAEAFKDAGATTVVTSIKRLGHEGEISGS